MTTKQFRLLLVANLFFSIVASLINFAFPSALPEPFLHAQSVYDAQQSTSSVSYILIIIFVLLILVSLITTYVGLFRFSSWAPRMTVFTTLLGTLSLPVMGVSVSSGWEAMLTDLSTTFWGVILALVYFSPIKDKFKVTDKHDSQGDPIASHSLFQSLKFYMKAYAPVILILIFAYFIGAINVFVTGKLIVLQPWKSIEQLILVGLIYWWYHNDKAKYKYSANAWLNVGVVALSVIFIPIYLYLSRIGKQRFKSIALFLIASCSVFITIFLGALSAKQFL